MQVWRSISRKKPEPVIERSTKESPDSDLANTKPVISMAYIVLYGIAGVVGAGIFTSPGKIIKDLAGPATLISYVLAGLACALSGVCYADFAARYPAAGGSYVYVYTSLGEYAAFIAGVGNTFEYAFAGSAVARSWSNYLVSLAPFLKGAKFSSAKDSVFAPDLFAPIVCILTSSVCLLGVKQSSKFSAALTTINIGVILFVIAVGAFYIDTSNYTPFFPSSPSGVFRGATSAFFSYIAWDSVCVLSEEVKEPRKTIPRAIFAVLAIVGALYCAFIFVLVGMKSAEEIDVDAPFANAFPDGHYAKLIVSILVLLCATNTTYASAQGQPRVWLGMARDGLLPKKFEITNERTGAPTFSIIVSGGLMALVAALFNFETIESATTGAVLLVQALVSVGCLLTRVKGRVRSQKGFKASILALALTTLCGAACFQQTASDSSKTVSISMCVLLGVSVISSLSTIICAGGNVKQTLVPTLAILANFFFVGVQGFMALIQMIGILAGFSLVYIFYGRRHSKLSVAE